MRRGIEDRSSAFLYYVGFTSGQKRNSVTGTQKIRQEIREIFGMDDPNDRYKFDTASGKLSRIKELCEWCKKDAEKGTDYQKAVARALEAVVDSSRLMDSINYLESVWRGKRNQLTHGLFNKNCDAVMDELQELVENGYHAA